MALVHVVAWVGVKYGINTTGIVVVVVNLVQGEAECNLSFPLQYE